MIAVGAVDPGAKVSLPGTVSARSQTFLALFGIYRAVEQVNALYEER